MGFEPMIDTDADVAEIHALVASFGQQMSPPVREATLSHYLARHPEVPPQRVIRDVRYGPNPRHRLDIHLPTSAPENLLPVLVFVHGGGFSGGDKSRPGYPLYDNVGRFAVENGFVGVTMTYRLAPDHPWPAGGEDVTLALSFLGSSVTAHGGDPTRLVIMGHSAGGAHVGTFLADDALRFGTSGVVGAILSSGIYDPATLQGESYPGYYGVDATALQARSSMSGIPTCGIPVLVLVAEYDLPAFHRQAMELGAAYIAITGHLPGLVVARGHNHYSSAAHYGTPGDLLSAAVKEFIFDVTGEH